MGSGVQLLLPGLFDLPLDEVDPALLRDRLPGLNRILGWSTTRENRDYSIDTLLAAALQIVAPDGEPDNANGLAMASAFAEGDEGGERLMLVEAMHLQAEMQGALAMPITDNPRNRQDAGKIIEDLGDYFSEDCEVSPLTDGLYLMRLRNFDPPRHYPHPLSVLGRNVGYLVEQSRQVMPWYRLVNEFQMFMHQHPLNAERLLEGQLPINSLWAWGAGLKPGPGSRPVFCCDNPLLRRFAESLGLSLCAAYEIPTGTDLDNALIVDLRLLQLLKTDHEVRLDELLLELEAQLLQPLLQALERNRKPLLLRAAYRVDFELGSRARYKFWRRPGNLGDWR